MTRTMYMRVSNTFEYYRRTACTYAHISHPSRNTLHSPRCNAPKNFDKIPANSVATFSSLAPRNVFLLTNEQQQRSRRCLPSGSRRVVYFEDDFTRVKSLGFNLASICNTRTRGRQETHVDDCDLCRLFLQRESKASVSVIIYCTYGVRIFRMRNIALILTRKLIRANLPFSVLNI